MENQRGKHPQFDTYWEQHRGLVWWASKLAARKLGGNVHDYLATYTIRLNRALYSFDPERGIKFASYYARRLYEDAIKSFLRFESESWALSWAKQNATTEALKQAEVEYAFHEQDNILYRVPEEHSDVMDEIIGSFETVEECWNFFCRSLDKRDRFILEARIRDGLTLEAIGLRLGITKQRVRQLYCRALDRIRERLALVQRFTELFQKRIDEP